MCLGRAGTDVAGLTRTLLDTPLQTATVGRALDDYVQAQIHGPLDLASDAEELVVDPSFAGTATGDALEFVARRYGFPLRWHPGFALAVDEVDAEFRGPAIPVLAARLHREFARPGAPVIGRGAVSVVTEPHRWADRGPAADTLQHLKQLWHVLVRFGTAHPS